MAWTAVPTIKVGSMIDAPWMNTYIRDNLNNLSTGFHSHGGGSGSGSRQLGGTTGMTVFYFADAAAPAGPSGTLNRIFTSGSMLGFRYSTGAVQMLTSTAHTHGY